jgi:hypothetical protein
LGSGGIERGRRALLVVEMHRDGRNLIGKEQAADCSLPAPLASSTWRRRRKGRLVRAATSQGTRAEGETRHGGGWARQQEDGEDLGAPAPSAPRAGWRMEALHPSGAA